ncbi:MAG: hypothetical protein A3J55_02360 [Candidatus Ryanbacteria bacterium RIFCSPHIGHO2_02_FULL_45_17b]|uniref:Uncharacterized protein n=1 Tax=Candidatus Ryanbacteria bacterium RIFCSPHIGHO2_01_FULL_45_22 TaxID=1802114 RepID=A0A1G2FZF0_9BACT|nr:MAG: hypothetical protein A2719_00800 [Candidatus Ryanbacteria bacterium RIFCSPHIGHO2_01_FULL_45_22]OGZ46774.1 MAG: hypothetical protein A3J55_02360 [Candidatus Ryanbacteria bacterium RIFCSPHIGHO2_02_FULL_45_17b]
MDFQSLLNEIPWFKKVFNLADTLPDTIPPPWTQRPVPKGVVLSAPLPVALRKILTANHNLSLKANSRIETHVNKHPGCSPYCSSVQEFMKELQDRRALTSFMQYCIMRYVDDSSNLWVILEDWRVAIFTPGETRLEILKDTFEHMPMPTEEEKRNGS